MHNNAIFSYDCFNCAKTQFMNTFILHVGRTTQYKQAAHTHTQTHTHTHTCTHACTHAHKNSQYRKTVRLLELRLN